MFDCAFPLLLALVSWLFLAETLRFLNPLFVLAGTRAVVAISIAFIGRKVGARSRVHRFQNGRRAVGGVSFCRDRLRMFSTPLVVAGLAMLSNGWMYRRQESPRA